VHLGDGNEQPRANTLSQERPSLGAPAGPGKNRSRRRPKGRSTDSIQRPLVCMETAVGYLSLRKLERKAIGMSFDGVGGGILSVRDAGRRETLTELGCGPRLNRKSRPQPFIQAGEFVPARGKGLNCRRRGGGAKIL